MSDPAKVTTETTDVLIIGSGGAGLRTAIALNDAKKKCVIVGKCKKREAHTKWAQGGINASLGNMDPKDSWQLHAADTIADGGYINNPQSVSLLCKHAPQVIEELAKWGCKFHREKDGRITQRFFGAASFRRACFVGDITGEAILNTLVDQVLKRKIPFQSEVYIFSLLRHKNAVNGALGLNMKTGEIIVYHAKAVVLATGGHSRMFGRSSSHFWENNGDGIALAHQCGATFMDMEMFQFHPTGMVWPKEASGLLVTEAVRGEGGILTNTKGQRFMKKYDPNRMELSARDIVARANYMEIKAGRGTKRGGVYLDVSHQSLAYLKKRLPSMVQRFKKFAKTDISKQKMEVAPTAHYSMGGIFTQHKTGKTGIKNLYAVGEVTAGVHGGNRLGGNSLAEICVFGRLVGEEISRVLPKLKRLPLDDDQIDQHVYDLIMLNEQGKGDDPITVKEELQQMMWQHAGVIRSGKLLEKGLKKLQAYKKRPLKMEQGLKNNEQLIAALDLINMIPTCEMILKSAMMRKESRAAHYRTDYKETSARWKKNIHCAPTAKSIRYWSEPVPAIPAAIQKKLEWKKDKEVSKALLE